MSPELSWVSLLWWRPFFQRCSWVSDFVPSSVALGLSSPKLKAQGLSGLSSEAQEALEGPCSFSVLKAVERTTTPGFT